MLPKGKKYALGAVYDLFQVFPQTPELWDLEKQSSSVPPEDAGNTDGPALVLWWVLSRREDPATCPL